MRPTAQKKLGIFPAVASLRGRNANDSNLNTEELVMKGTQGAMKSVMTGATLASMMMLVGAQAEAGQRVWNLVPRKLAYESVRSELGDQLYACWNRSNVVVATSPVGWQKEMERVQDQLCVLPAPAAPQANWSRHGLVVIAYSNGMSLGSTMTINVRGVSRLGDKLMVDASVAPRTDGCGTCDQDQIRLSRRDLAGVKSVVVSYTDESMGASLATESHNVEGAGDDVSYLVSWGSMKAMYR